ncbi:hypothetical protein GCM10023322_10110 [Rugosimonospora acidiphila]|uniref:Transposase DDE domain-containing protein n=1 Tax=Rugosimonospora acidiphila TaxID=556531 RepID=A0ABP9RM75_9ACTN
MTNVTPGLSTIVRALHRDTRGVPTPGTQVRPGNDLLAQVEGLERRRRLATAARGTAGQDSGPPDNWTCPGRLGVYRWVVEHGFSLLYGFRRMRMSWEIRDDIHEAFLRLACVISCWHRFAKVPL